MFIEMTGFIGRKAELGVLNESYRASSSAFIPIYGRRRVGKSELILHFMRDKPGVYFLGKQAPAKLQIQEFLAEASAELQQPLLANFAAQTWGEAFDAVVSQWTSAQKLIIALDEFQWMVATSPELPSILQEKWDRSWKRHGKIVLILCGSYIGFMEREVLGRNSPLFGRRTRQIHLRAFNYREAALFHPNYSLVDRAKAYFICGGVPLYLKFFSDRRSIESNLIHELLNEYAPLHREGDFLLREELRDVESYYAILVSLAAAKTTNTEIAQHAGIEVRSLHYYLQQLLELGYIKRRYPLTGEKPIVRHVRYQIADPLLRFWFRFIFPNTSHILHAGANNAMRDRIRPHLEAYFGYCFEQLCREALPDIYAREHIAATFEVGEYWSKQTQIDVIGYRDDGWVDIGECKWGAVRSPKRLQEELEHKIPQYPNLRNASIGRRIFCRQKPKNLSSHDIYQWYDLEDIFR